MVNKQAISLNRFNSRILFYYIYNKEKSLFSKQSLIYVILSTVINTIWVFLSIKLVGGLPKVLVSSFSLSSILYIIVLTFLFISVFFYFIFGNYFSLYIEIFKKHLYFLILLSTILPYFISPILMAFIVFSKSKKYLKDKKLIINLSNEEHLGKRNLKIIFIKYSPSINLEKELEKANKVISFI